MKKRFSTKSLYPSSGMGVLYKKMGAERPLITLQNQLNELLEKKFEQDRSKKKNVKLPKIKKKLEHSSSNIEKETENKDYKDYRYYEEQKKIGEMVEIKYREMVKKLGLGNSLTF